MPARLALIAPWGRSAALVRHRPSHRWLTGGRPGDPGGDHGATAVEYGLMVGLIAVVIAISVVAFGHNVSDLYNVPSSIFAP
jgi:Flp pilus assembly pilin Flp